MITQEYLKSIFEYNELTGEFTRKIKIARKSKIGEVAGYLDPSKSSGYIRIQINKKFYLAHRLVWLYVYGKFPESQIDHINHIRHDNRILNLREVTRQKNNRNCSLSLRNKSGFTGVFFNKKSKRYQAYIHHIKFIHLGMFDSIEDAINARKEANIKYGYDENHGKKC